MERQFLSVKFCAVLVELQERPDGRILSPAYFKNGLWFHGCIIEQVVCDNDDSVNELSLEPLQCPPCRLSRASVGAPDTGISEIRNKCLCYEPDFGIKIMRNKCLRHRQAVALRVRCSLHENMVHRGPDLLRPPMLSTLPSFRLAANFWWARFNVGLYQPPQRQAQSQHTDATATGGHMPTCGSGEETLLAYQST